MNKLIFLIIGVILSSVGLLFMILYLNLVCLGYSFLEYVKVISSSFECWLFIIGLLIIFGGRIKNAILLQFKSKYK